MRATVFLIVWAATLGVAACAQEPQATTQASAIAPTSTTAATTSHQNMGAHVVVHKSQACGCCDLWVEHMREAGFHVEVNTTENIEPVKARMGVAPGIGSCHTAVVDGYFIEGHVPASDVTRLLVERPPIRGLAVPGMPIGSPGMEQGGVSEPYDVIAVATDGSMSVFAHHGT